MSEFTDTVAPAASVKDVGFARGPVVNETIEEGEIMAKTDGDSFSELRDRHIPEAVLAKIDALAGKRLVQDKPAAAAKVDDDGGPIETEEEPVEVVAEGEVAAEVEAAPVEATDDLVSLKAERDRYLESNRALVADLEAARSRKPVATPRHKLLDEAHRLYLDDTSASLRHFVAANLGLDDINDPKVAAEMRDLYLDLTAIEVGVTPDPAHQAKREAARTRQMWDREKRQRTAEEQEKANEGQHDADAKKAEAAATFIAPRLQQIASDYPLLISLSEVFDGVPPEALVWKILERESKTGRLQLTADDDANIRAAAKLIEDHYAPLVDRVGKAKPPSPTTTSTAKPIAVTSASKETRQSHGARTLTTKDASVAPATPPATKPAPKKDEPPKFKSKDEAKEYALRHLNK